MRTGILIMIMAATVGLVRAEEGRRDMAATRFMNTCAGCHSLTGVKLTGPDLSLVAAWPMEQLKAAIKRMEKNVGPLKDEDVTMVAELLKAPDVRERLKLEEARIQAQFAAKLEPPSAVIGQKLFFGQTPFQNAGMACLSCHAVAGQGGNLGPDLTGVFGRMGETPLVSAIEKTSFKVMAPHYRWHPITRQEALHITKYLSTLDAKTATPVRTTFIPMGVGTALAAFVGLAFYFKSSRTGREKKLQRRNQ